jgi:hypothetical protein
MGVLNMIGQRDQIKKIYSDYLHSSITEQLVKTANSLREFFLDEDDTDWEVLQSCIWVSVFLGAQRDPANWKVGLRSETSLATRGKFFVFRNLTLNKLNSKALLHMPTAFKLASD